MTTKKVYEKIQIIPKTTVAGNIKDHKQQYERFFYPKSDDLVEKFALYIYLGEDYAKRSIFFSSTEQLRRLIFDLTKAYFYFRDKKVTPINTREQFRLTNLADFLVKLRENQLNIWKESVYKTSQPLSIEKDL